MFHGLQLQQARKLAYKFAVQKGKAPKSWITNQTAGEAWLLGFRRRHDLSLRSPEATGLKRSMAFNKPVVQNFFEKLRQVYDRFEASPDKIWNLDETGLATVQKPRQILAPTGTKQVGQITSAERGVTVTICCCISAEENSLPPAYIFPRVNFKDHMLIGAPAGSLGLACKSGWMSNDLFPKVLLHFIKRMHISSNNQALLLLDNHTSHISIEAIDKAKENGLILLTLPPRCSHKLQPLDVSVYAAFKKYYNSVCDGWMLENPEKPISIYDVASLSNKAYEKAFPRENINSGFRSTGIWPFDENVFPDDAFLPSLVTDCPQQTSDNGAKPNLDAGLEESLNTNDNAELNTSINLEDHNLLQQLRPYPKSTARATGARSNRRKSSSTTVLTDTPEKEKLFSPPKSKPSSSKQVKKIVRKQLELVSSSDSENEDDSDMPSLTDSEEYSSELDLDESANENALDVNINDYVEVKVHSGLNFQNFVAGVTQGLDDDEDYEVSFYKKVNNGFILPDEEDCASVSALDVVMVLPKLFQAAATKRLLNVVKFPIDLTSFNLK